MGSEGLQRVLGAAGSLFTTSVVPHHRPISVIRTRHLGGGAVVSICSCQGNLCNLLLSSAPLLTPSIFVLVFHVASLLLWQLQQWVSCSPERAFTNCCHNRMDSGRTLSWPICVHFFKLFLTEDYKYMTDSAHLAPWQWRRILWWKFTSFHKVGLLSFINHLQAFGTIYFLINQLTATSAKVLVQVDHKGAQFRPFAVTTHSIVTVLCLTSSRKGKHGP